MTHSASAIKPINSSLLRQALVTPEILGELSLAEWDRLLPQARSAGLLARLDILLKERRLSDRIPPQTIPHFTAARRIAGSEHCAVHWEVNRIARALRGIDVPIVLLKGAAYAIRDLPNARGRIASDVDILVAKENLDTVEDALLKHGWTHIKLAEYDQYFYRHWSHELPPLQHRDRGTIVDVHHTILPPTGRLRPDPQKLLAAAVRVEGTIFSVLAPADMVLHSAAHAFQDGDLQRGLRDLVDIDDLLRHFSGEAGFWNKLISRAEELDLSRPLFYALRYSRRFLTTPVPQWALVASKKWQPLWPAVSLMDALVETMLEATGSLRFAPTARLARQALYIRSHWLRMPPYLLIPHLTLKTIRAVRMRDTKHEVH